MLINITIKGIKPFIAITGRHSRNDWIDIPHDAASSWSASRSWSLDGNGSMTEDDDVTIWQERDEILWSHGVKNLGQTRKNRRREMRWKEREMNGGGDNLSLSCVTSSWLSTNLLIPPTPSNTIILWMKHHMIITNLHPGILKSWLSFSSLKRKKIDHHQVTSRWPFFWYFLLYDMT